MISKRRIVAPFVFAIMLGAAIAGIGRVLYASQFVTWLWVWTPFFLLLVGMAVAAVVALLVPGRMEDAPPSTQETALAAVVQKVTAEHKAQWERN